MTLLKKRENSPTYLLEEKLTTSGYRTIAGVDEAGRGPLAGPVVAAAIILKDKTLPLNDSKKLSRNQRQSLYQALITNGAIAFAIAEASVEEIDEINILQATLLAMQRAIASLKVKPDHLLVDGNHLPITPIPATDVIKGDSLSLSIAAASILAKERRDQIMEELDRKWPEYGFAKHKGYGTKAHLQALEKFGPTPIHRKTFAPVGRFLCP